MVQKNISAKCKYQGKNVKIGIVFSEFNKKIGEELLNETLKELKKCKVKNIEIFTVPGALEIPVVCKKIIKKRKYDAIIALGVVIKGETTHFKHVSSESIKGIIQISIQYETPIICGILTVLNEKQAIKRVSRGKEYAQSALHIINTLKNI
jgi:6,7-dimethyl-8-ribityllumazine synthase